MDLNARKDQFSRAVVRAVAATAGVRATVPEFDEDSVDITFTAADIPGAGPGLRLDAQLQCSANIRAEGGSFTFPLPVKNYNDLRWEVSQLYVPRILIVVDVPSDPDDWLEIARPQMTLRRCAYWMSLAGFPETSNTSSVTINIPTEQVFDVAALSEHLRPPGASL